MVGKKPDIDLFASIANYKCERYISWFQDPGAESVDAFTPGRASHVQGAYPGSSQTIREAFRRKGIPEAALDTMVGSLSDNTIKQYSIRSSSGGGNFVNLETYLHSSVRFQMVFWIPLRIIFGPFNAYPCSLLLITSKNLGEDPQVKRRFLGFVHPNQKYKSTWDPQQVLQFFLENSSHDSLKFLSCKLVTLLALATGERLQTISLIKCSNITFPESGATIRIPDIVKTSRPNFHQPNLSLPYFTRNPRLCVASCLTTLFGTQRLVRRSVIFYFLHLIKLMEWRQNRP
ncbi:hypothetical protein NQ317_016361 [Molorchus minor]|uniref:Tyr recombinase domain-containing protein n=1 Tax=Molorchus minor TaxID=1323400 RepID=A0ABQ9JGM8_9CUCU|nr:hypothetical protein NQ317_016361 [Molorchus minor]